ncbi:hypothetical protein AcW1_009296 [Taiwanofungus camphoratus]|nr:hypothetical protein AcW1_009296 [Antrodia cinnamomea]
MIGSDARQQACHSVPVDWPLRQLDKSPFNCQRLQAVELEESWSRKNGIASSIIIRCHFGALREFGEQRKPTDETSHIPEGRERATIEMEIGDGCEQCNEMEEARVGSRLITPIDIEECQTCEFGHARCKQMGHHMRIRLLPVLKNRQMLYKVEIRPQLLIVQNIIDNVIKMRAVVNDQR